MPTLNFKNYLIGGVSVAIIVLILGIPFGNDIAGALGNLHTQLVRVGLGASLANVILNPLIAVFENPVPGAIGAGLLWPMTLLWFVFAFSAFIYSIVAAGAITSRGAIS